MKKAVLFAKRNLWILILDIISVNASYYLALLIRFFLHNQFDHAWPRFLQAFVQFAPFYTILCLIVFFLFRLYNGMWRYAGINDLNRIAAANLCTAAIQIIGTAVFLRRMPLSYYAIGAVLQLFCIMFSRFIYRLYIIERNRFASKKATSINVMIIGANEIGRGAIRNMIGNSVLRPACFLEKRKGDEGKVFDGIPVFDLDSLEAKIKEYKIKMVIVTDDTLSEAQHADIREKCAGIELIDYTGYVKKPGAVVSLTALLEKTPGPVKIVIGNTEKEYADGMSAVHALHEKKYNISCIGAVEGKLRIELAETFGGAFSGYEEWARQYKEQTGEDPTFF